LNGILIQEFTQDLSSDEVHTVADLMRLFARYLGAVATGPVSVRSEAEPIEVLYGDSGFIVDETLAATIRMYNDWPWPITASKQADDLTGLPRGLVEAVGAFEIENTFTTEIAFPISSTGLDTGR